MPAGHLHVWDPLRFNDAVQNKKNAPILHKYRRILGKNGPNNEKPWQ